MPIVVISVMQIAGGMLGVAAIAYLIIALWTLARYREGATRVAGFAPGVSVLKPVYGASEGLYSSLRSFADQDWPKYEVIFGLHTAADQAIPVIERVIRDLPGRDIRYIIDERLAGPNRKAANLANIDKHAKYEIVILSDQDVVVDRNCIASMVAPLADPAVGGATAIYKGVPINTPAARFGALYINDWFVPSVVVDTTLRGIDFSFGALTSIRRETLHAFGGFDRLAQCLAEDFSLGRFVVQAGKKMALARYACGTIVDDQTFAAMFRHEARWQRSERACRPLDHFMSVVTWPLPLLIALLLPEPSVAGLSLIGAETALRIVVHYAVRSSFVMKETPPRPWIVPLREMVCFAAWFAGLFGNKVQWGVSTFSVKDYRRMMRAGKGEG